MKIRDLILLIALLIFNGHFIFSQTKEIDSLKLLLVSAKEDTNKVQVLSALAYNSNSSRQGKNGLQYGKEALVLAEKLDYTQGKAVANYQLAYSYGLLFDFSENVKYLFTALKYYEELGKKEWAARCYQSIGAVFLLTSDTANTIAYFLKALKLRKEIGDKSGIAQTYNSIGELYLNQGKHAEALEQHFAALEITSKPEPDAPGWGPAYTHECLGNVYHTQGDIAYAAGNKKNAAVKYKVALQHFFTSLAYWKKFGQADAIPYLYVPIGNMYAKLNNIILAKDYLLKATELGLQLGDKEVLRNAYLGLSMLDSMKGNYEQAYNDYKIYIQYRDSIVNQETVKKIEGYRAQNEFGEKEDSLKQIHSITETKLQLQKKEKYFYLTGFIMLALLSFFIFNSFRKQKKINWLAAKAHAGQKAALDLRNLQAIAEERLRISSDLHDEVGATLSGIAMYSHLTKEQLKSNNTSGINNSLEVIQQNSSQMVDKLNDIVWFINPEQDSIQQLINRLENYVYKMAAIKDIKASIKKSGITDDIPLSTEIRRNIYLFCKEAINNSIKHSMATLFEFAVERKKDVLEFIISDNGKSFDTKAASNGNGLKNMQKRAYDMGADFFIQSRPGDGCHISLTLKITQRGIA